MFNSRGVGRGLALLALLLVPILWQDMPVVGAARLAWLDGYQELSRAKRRSAPASSSPFDEQVWTIRSMAVAAHIDCTAHR